jgi:hypothetical protein
MNQEHPLLTYAHIILVVCCTSVWFSFIFLVDATYNVSDHYEYRYLLIIFLFNYL